VAAEAGAVIATARGVVIAAVIAVVLVGVVVLDGARSRGAVDRALVPGFDPARVTELVWARPGQPAIRAVRAGGWQLIAPSRAPADPDAIGEVLAALRGARWHRRGAVAGAGAVTTELTVVSGGERRVLGLGAPVAGTEQRWIVDGAHGVLVDRWVARALDRAPLALRITRPLAEVASAATIVIEGEPPARGVPGARVDLRLAGAPRRLVRPVALVLAGELAAALERALRDVEIVRLPDGPVAGPGLAITIAGQDPAAPAAISVELAGDCPGAPERVAVSGTAGDGCIERAAADAIVRAVAHLLQPPAAIVEPRPLTFEPTRIVLGDGAEVDPVASRVGGRPADPTRVAELLAALAAPAEVVPLPTTPATQQLIAADGDATTTLDLFAGGVLARRGEPVALRVASGAWALLVRPSRALREPGLWLEEPTTITGVRIDDVAYVRGAVIGSWSRLPRGAADAATLEALVGQLAAPRARGFVEPTAPTASPAGLVVAHRVTLTVTPPAGPPVERVLELGAPRAAGCPARVAGDIVVLPARICAQVASLGRPRARATGE
jgi:hypothetical protein